MKWTVLAKSICRIAFWLTFVSITFLGPQTLFAQKSEVVFDIRIAQGRVEPAARVIRVHQGDLVTIRYTVDRPIILHLHGYDITTKATPGTVAEMSFTAQATGRFPVEEHSPDSRAGHSHGEAPIVRVEVWPR
jgi:hypothetical protein